MIQSTTAPPALAGIDAHQLLGFSFPTSELLDAAADLFPVPAHSQHTWSSTWHNRHREGAALKEGPWPRLQLGPGILRLTRHDLGADERAKERALSERYRQVDALVGGYEAPVLQPRGEIRAWSPKSRANLVRSILSMDLAPLVAHRRLPVMVTLTLPGRWLEVTPDAGTAARKFDNFRRAWADKWGSPQWIWKREFQRRGAPHWHLWLVPPSADLREFQEWLSAAWTNALAIIDPEERRLSLAAGTNVSMAEGMRARDPKRLAVYFLKESLGGEGKAYQNEPPAAWAGQSVGRYWGVAGIDYALRSVDLDPQLAVKVWRILRGIRRSHSGATQQLVPRVNHKTGEIRYRKVTRRSRARGTAGWIAVNDGAAAASQLARYLATCTPT